MDHIASFLNEHAALPDFVNMSFANKLAFKVLRDYERSCRHLSFRPDLMYI